MSLLDEELQEIDARKKSARNLKHALVALTIYALTEFYLFFARDLLVRSIDISPYVLFLFFYLLKVSSAVFACMAVLNGFKTISLTKNNDRNYIAIAIGSILLIIIIRGMFFRFTQ